MAQESPGIFSEYELADSSSVASPGTSVHCTPDILLPFITNQPRPLSRLAVISEETDESSLVDLTRENQKADFSVVNFDSLDVVQEGASPLGRALGAVWRDLPVTLVPVGTEISDPQTKDVQRTAAVTRSADVFLTIYGVSQAYTDPPTLYAVVESRLGIGQRVEAFPCDSPLKLVRHVAHALLLGLKSAHEAGMEVGGISPHLVFVSGDRVKLDVWLGRPLTEQGGRCDIMKVANVVSGLSSEELVKNFVKLCSTFSIEELLTCDLFDLIE